MQKPLNCVWVGDKGGVTECRRDQVRSACWEPPMSKHLRVELPVERPLLLANLRAPVESGSRLRTAVNTRGVLS